MADCDWTRGAVCSALRARCAVIRYLRLFGYFLRFSFSRAMEFRLDFFFRIAMDVCFYVVNLLFFDVVYRHTETLGGWGLDQVYVFVAGFLLVDAISMTLFSNNLWLLSTYVNRGDLDYHLVRPVSPLFMVSLRDFAANSFMNLLIACGVMIWAIGRYPGELSWYGTVLFVLLLFNGAYLRYLVRMMTIIPVFWLHSTRGMEIVFFHMAQFVGRPDRIFVGVTRVLLTTILPFSLMVSFPARIFLQGFNALLLLWVLGVTLVFTFIVFGSWRAGLRVYSSASS